MFQIRQGGGEPYKSHQFSRNGRAEVAVRVQAIEMPRLGTGKTKVYIKFDSLPSAQKGHQNLHGRSFEARCESFPLAVFQQISVPDKLLLRIWQACGGELLPGGEIRGGGVRVRRRRQCFRA